MLTRDEWEWSYREKTRLWGRKPVRMSSGSNFSYFCFVGVSWKSGRYKGE